jgi:hypothetical protein
MTERGKSLAEMTAEIREVNIVKGWRSGAGGPGSTTFGTYLALLHSEISEALEAYRDHRLADATEIKDMSQHPLGIPPKPEGVGSEFADILIRLLDMCDVFGLTPFDMDCELGDVARPGIPVTRDCVKSFGDHMAWLHFRVALIDPDPARIGPVALSYMLRALVFTADHFGIDLMAEYERKIAYNRTRPYQHGGRTVADAATA